VEARDDETVARPGDFRPDQEPHSVARIADEVVAEGGGGEDGVLLGGGGVPAEGGEVPGEV